MEQQPRRGNLIISREAGDSVQIGDNVTIDIVKVSRNGKVRIGIRAPRGVQILRHDAKTFIPRQG